MVLEKLSLSYEVTELRSKYMAEAFSLPKNKGEIKPIDEDLSKKIITLLVDMTKDTIWDTTDRREVEHLQDVTGPDDPLAVAIIVTREISLPIFLVGRKSEVTSLKSDDLHIFDGNTAILNLEKESEWEQFLFAVQDGEINNMSRVRTGEMHATIVRVATYQSDPLSSHSNAFSIVMLRSGVKDGSGEIVEAVNCHL